jgi:hypothetical protein
MKRILEYKNIALVAGLLLICGAANTFAQRARPVLHKRPVTHKASVTKPPEPLLTVASGTIMRVRMNQTISSKTAIVGSTFTSTVVEPVYASNGAVVIPVGSVVTGRVNTVRPAAKGGVVGQIDCSFISVRLPNGHKHLINGSLTDLTDGKTTNNNEGTASGKPIENRKVVFIGGGTAGGAILGAMVGGGKGAAIGAILGAGGGFLGERYLNGKEAEVRSGTQFGINLNRSIALPKFAEATPSNQ